LLLAARVLAEGMRRRGVARSAAVALLGAVVAGSLWQVIDFVRAGRGEFHDALAWIAERDARAIIRVTGDHDFRVGTCTRFYRSYLEREVVYVAREGGPDKGVEWLLV